MATKPGAITKYWDRKSLHYGVPIFLVAKNEAVLKIEDTHFVKAIV